MRSPQLVDSCSRCRIVLLLTRLISCLFRPRPCPVVSGQMNIRNSLQVSDHSCCKGWWYVSFRLRDSSQQLVVRLLGAGDKNFELIVREKLQDIAPPSSALM